VAEHHPIEVRPPDIEPYRASSSGVEFVHSFDSGRPGPSVMLQALTHGNEFCGAHALIEVLDSRLLPQAGKLIVAFANVAAFARFDFDDPDASRYIDEDYNRVWADDVLYGPRDSAELRRAREMRRFVDAADFLLDLHSMHEPGRPIMVCGMVDKHLELARKVGLPADLLIDTGHPAGLRMRDRGGFNDPASPRQSLLIECGQHWEKRAEVEMPLLTEKPSELVRKSEIYFSIEPGESQLPATIDYVGADHFVWASDIPHWDSEFPGNLEHLRNHTVLSEEVKEKILYKNAQRLFNL